MITRILVAVSVVAALAGATLLLSGYNRPLKTLDSYAITCGGTHIDGGPATLADGGRLDGGPGVDGGFADGGVATFLDGGYPITEVNDGTFRDAVLAGNPSATVVYFGDATVQPNDGFAICNTTASCSRTDISADIMGNTMYCTGATAATVRVLAAGL